jgi:hypothetical protein
MKLPKMPAAIITAVTPVVVNGELMFLHSGRMVSQIWERCARCGGDIYPGARIDYMYLTGTSEAGRIRARHVGTCPENPAWFCFKNGRK